GLLLAVIVVDVLEEPVLARVPGVPELPVVAARVVAAPAARARAELPQLRSIAVGLHADPVDERAYRVGGRLAAKGHRHLHGAARPAGGRILAGERAPR